MTVHPTSDAVKNDLDYLLYRSYISMGKFSTVLDGIKDSPGVSVALQV